MLTIYNNKEYKCFSLPNGQILLLSDKPEDNTWTKCEQDNKCIYKKIVNKSECERFYCINCYGLIKGQKIEIIDADNDKVMVVGNTDDYTQEFIETVFGGKKGREIRKWCNISVFSEFEIEYFEDNEHINTVHSVTAEQVKGSVKKMFCLC